MGAALALASSLFWGTGDFLAGTLSRRRAAFAVAGAAQIVGLVFMLIVAVATRAWEVDGHGYVGWAVLASLAGLTGLAAFYHALAVGRMSIVSPIAALGVLVPLGAGLLGGDVPTPLQYVGIGLAIIGVLLASGPELGGEVGLGPVLLAGLAALMFGLFLTFVAHGAQTSAVMTMTVQRTASATIVVVVAVVVGSLGGLRRGDAGMLITIGVFDVSANLLYGLATTFGLLAVVSVLGSLYPVVTVILAWIVHHERLRRIQYWGVACALVGVAGIGAG